MLTLGPGLAVPDGYVTSTGALLAVRGAGKSNTAAVMAEEMFAQKLPFVVVDPVGAWWGLRSSGNGTGPGLSVPIFGGKRGDLTLERGAGELVADLVVEQRLSCVLDLSTFHSEGDKKAFLLAFALRLYQKNEDPLHLFLEEADDYIPQRPMREEAHLLRAFENIVRRGRGRGLGITLITQRSAAINKNVLTQTETLFAMRTTGPQDIAAIEAWVKYHQVDGQLLASLAGLEDGEAWVWSPHFLKTVKRVKIRRRWTFDSGATPKNVKAGQERKVATLADVDLEALRGRMAETIERVKADDPKELRRQIAELRSGMAILQRQQPEPQRVEVPVLSSDDRIAFGFLVNRVREEANRLVEVCGKVAADIDATLRPLQHALDGRHVGVIPSSPLASGAGQTGRTMSVRVEAARLPRTLPTAAASTAAIDGAQQKILDVVAMLGVRGLTPNREMVARWLDIHPNGGRYGSNLAVLRAEGYLDGFTLTDKGHKAARTMETGLGAALEPLDGAQRAIVDVLNHSHRPHLTRDTLAEKLGIHPNGGRYGSNLARLRTMGLIPDRGAIYLTDEVYR